MLRDDAPSPPALWRQTTSSVLSAVRRTAPQPQRIAELVRATGLTRPTVAQAVEELMGEGLIVVEAPAGQGRIGRPAVRVRLDGLAAPVLGIDVGVHSVAASVADLTGQRLSLRRLAVAGAGNEAMVAALDTVIAEALSEAGIARTALASVAAGCPGIVDAEVGRITLRTDEGQWSSFDLLRYLRRACACPIRLENNANLVASAVFAARTDAPHTLLAVQWGERLGAGIVIEGRLHRGATLAAGEIGFIRPEGSPPRLGMTEDGPLESAIGSGGIVRRARVAAAADPTSTLGALLGRSSTPADAAKVFEAAADGDAAAVAVVDDVARLFSAAVAPIVLALDPDALVIGGGVARAGGLLTEAIQRHLSGLTLHTPTVELSPLAQDAVIVGAILSALDDVWQRLLSRSEPG